MNKLIIENQADISMYKALEYARVVIKQGRVSNFGKQYCYHTVFKDGTVITSFLNEKSDRLLIEDGNE